MGCSWIFYGNSRHLSSCRNASPRAVDNIPALLGHDETEAQDDAASAGGSCDRVWVTTSHDPKMAGPPNGGGFL